MAGRTVRLIKFFSLGFLFFLLHGTIYNCVSVCVYTISSV